MIFDAHFHYAVCTQRKVFNPPENWCGLSCAHSFEEWEIQSHSPNNVYKAFGIHPQVLCKLNREQFENLKIFLEGLAKSGKLTAIGEAGFDYFTQEFKSTKALQEEAWKFQLEICLKYNLPIVIHNRKANEKLFEYSPILKKLPWVIFHSFMGSLVEAESLIKRNINCFFSFGKQMMNNNKKVIDCVKNLPINNLLIETDGPFQTLKGEENTEVLDILKIYKEAYKLRNMEKENISYEKFCDLIFNNAKTLCSTIQI